ncbi:hypothetical protein HPB51_019571 [Rhipicephalus microplus]|uniref:CRAL-TRIO domain-containing protein n=1 Tax=Rhipicephalus microplus TaxID=6941 RepID=A0A9J6DW76_RHIMP|nr:hypothetical protein HPB51_019571 [Rhipicephalus microplus]
MDTAGKYVDIVTSALGEGHAQRITSVRTAEPRVSQVLHRAAASDMGEATMAPAASLESIEDVARRELGETPATKQTALNELRQLIISEEPSLHCPTDDAFLVKFLRARKYDTRAAFKNIKKYFKVRTEHPEIRKRISVENFYMTHMTRIQSSRMNTHESYVFSYDHTRLLDMCRSWNSEICSITDVFRVNLLLLEHFLQLEDIQVRGIITIFDFKGLNMYHLAHYTPSVIRTLINLVQECIPMRLKGIYIINHPPIFNVLFAIIKTFLKAKLLKRTRLFGYDLKELHQLVPEDVIPEESGGTNESYDYDPLERELESEEGFYRNLSSYGYRDTPAQTEHKYDGLLTDKIP